jgi:hypothetical protein
VLLPTLLASADVNFLLEDIVGAMLQPIAYHPHCCSSLAPHVFVGVRGSRRAAGRWRSSFLCLFAPMYVPLHWFALLHLTSLASLIADALPLSLSSLADALPLVSLVSS